MSAVNLALIAGVSLYAYTSMRSPTEAKAKQMTYECQETYCPPFYQIQVDPALVTNLRDDRTPWAAKTGALDCQECGIAKSTNSMGLKEVYETTKRVFHDEVINSPGVRLVAHAIE